jgi:hypothetical protein
MVEEVEEDAPIMLIIFMLVTVALVVVDMVARTTIHIQTILPLHIMATILLPNFQITENKLKVAQSTLVVVAVDLEPHIIPIILVVLVDLVLLSLDIQSLQL